MMDHSQPLRLYSGSLNLFTPHKPPSFSARFVRAGAVRAAGNQPSHLYIQPQALLSAVQRGLFDNRAVFIDHSSCFENPSLRNLVAVTSQAAWDEETSSVNGVFTLYETPDASVISDLLQQLVVQSENCPDIGLSMVFWADHEEDGNGNRSISYIHHVESVDLVFEPAADGRVLQALSALTLTPLSPYPSIDSVSIAYPEQIEEPHLNETQAFTSMSSGNGELMSLEKTIPYSQKGVFSMSIPDTVNELNTESKNAPAGADWAAAAAQSVARTLIITSDLPQPSKDRLCAHSYNTPADVSAAIESERTYLAMLNENNVIQIPGQAPRGSAIQFGRTGYEQLQLAAEALIDGVRPPEGIRPLTGVRELYQLLSGDYELTGVFHPERVQFANVTSSTMAGLVANALNKRVINEFMQYPRWWEPITIAEDFSTLQEVKWITLAGIGEIPTVAEGAAYTELQWDDRTETAAFIKKGGYLGITIEAIDKDDTGRLRAAPRALAQAAYLTLAKAISAIFTDNAGTGPHLSDGNHLFDASNHANLGSSALSPSVWATTRVAMRSQLELDGGGGSPAALGALTAPRFLLIPNELENEALSILGAATSGSANYLDNNWAEGDTHTQRLLSARTRVIVMDMWTDANDWAAVADPLFYPTIGIGYRYGRAPEIFSVAAPNQGLMFTNDVMPVKVRFFFAVGPMDWKGLYKHNV